jgi:hypothetical protein
MARVDNNVIIENLTQLLTNTVNMTSVFYDIFLNPEEMDVELQQYNAEGELITISIPNRAKDRRIAIVGEGSPEGVEVANPGAVYVDELNETVYFKATGTEDTGWVIVLTEEGVNTYLRSYLTTNKFMTEDMTQRYLNDNQYTTQSTVSDMLEQYKPTIYMTSIPSASGQVTLADNNGYAITITGNTTFILPTITNLNILHKIFIQLYVSGNYTVNLNTTNYFDNLQPAFASGGMFNLMYEYDNNREVWVVGAISKGTSN